MSALVDTVLSFNRLEMTNNRKHPVAVDVGRFCRDLAEELRVAYCNGHEFSVSIVGNCGTALLDEVLFRRIVENLLTNAFRYTPAGGSVSLFVSCEQGLLRITVADTGIGIPNDCESRVFEAFYRCDNVETRRGLGLGLSIVQEALLQLGGTITVDSTVGEGTSMRVEIPVIDSPESEEQTTSCTTLS